jgi:TonB family protein
MWFERKTDDVLNVNVSSVGGVACESPSIALSSLTTGFPVLTVYDDTIHREGLPEQSPLDHIPMITDAKFVHEVAPVYPPMLLNQGLTGRLMIGIDIGGDGKALYAWIRARDSMLGSNSGFDGSAIWAALNSTYAPMISDGRPKTSTYLLIYEYRQSGDRDAVDAVFDVSKQCPVILGSLRVSVSDRNDHTQWYSFSVSAKGSNPPTSIVLAVRDTLHKSTGLIWNPIPLRRSPKDPSSWYADGSFNWKGAPITLAWVDQATTSDGKVVNCQAVSEAPFNLADSTDFPRYIAGDPLPLLSMQQVVPAEFVREAWPQYRSGPNGAHEAGYVVVQSVVDDAGVVREAFLIQSSGVGSLDSAALHAATSSEYRPAASGAVAMYEAVYQFVP